MFNLDQLRQQIDRYLAGDLSLSELEDWFSIESWNVHQWGSAQEIDRVFSLESLFSKYHFENLGESSLRLELAMPIGPFEASIPKARLFELEYGRAPYLSL